MDNVEYALRELKDLDRKIHGSNNFCPDVEIGTVDKHLSKAIKKLEKELENRKKRKNK